MIDEVEARGLLDSPDLIAIGVRADDVRRRMHGGRTTFVRVFEIHVGAIPSALPPRFAAGELRIVGRPSSIDDAVAAVRATAGLAASIPITGFSLADLSILGGASSLSGTCAALRAAGLEAIAEVSVDVLNDTDAGARGVEAARAAGLAVTRMTVSAFATGDPLAVVTRARDLQAAAGGFRVFAPLPRTLSISAPTTGYDDVKQVAIARLVGANIDSIQVDWALYGPKLAQFALTVGADDVDSVAAVDPGTLGTRRSPLEEIRGNIRSAALEPIERNARYEAIG